MTGRHLLDDAEQRHPGAEKDAQHDAQRRVVLQARRVADGQDRAHPISPLTVGAGQQQRE